MQKQAVRRLVRLPDGTVGVRYYDLASGLEVLDLTGYSILEPSQEASLPGAKPKSEQDDNSGGKKVGINPSLGGSLETEVKLHNTGTPTPYTTSNAGALLSKNPALNAYLSQFPPAPVPETAQTTQPGRLTVDPNFDPNNELGGPPSQDVDLSGVDEDGNAVDRFGNVSIVHTNAPEKTSVFTAIDQDRFNPGLQEAVEQAAQEGTFGASNFSTEDASGTFGLGEGLVDRAGLAPGSTGMFSDSMANLGLPTGQAPSYPNTTVPGSVPGVGLYTAAQVNIEQGLPSFQNAVRPELDATGLPAARESTAKSVISDAASVVGGARPEGTASGLPGARMDAPSTERFGADLPSSMSFNDRVASATRQTSPMARDDVSIAAGGTFAPGPAGLAMTPSVQSAMTQTQTGTPSAERFGYTPETPAKGFTQSLRDTYTKVDGMGNLNQSTPVAPGGVYDPARAGMETIGITPSPTAGMTNAAARPEGVATGLPAATGVVSSLPSSVSVTPTSAPRSGTPRTGGLNAAFFGTPDNPSGKPPSTAKTITSEAKDVSGSMKTSQQEVASMSPARAATMGFITRTPAEQEAIGKMIAGELHANTLKNLSATDPNVRALARTEFANIATTVENRIGSNLFGGSVAKTLNPRQYQSLMNTPIDGSIPMDNTMANYAKFGTSIQNTMKEYYAGQLTPTNWNYSSYYNPVKGEPKWGPLMTEAQQVGYHRFGILPEYAPGQAFQTERARLAAAYDATNRGWTPSIGGVQTGVGSMANARAQDRASVAGYSGAGSSFGAGSMAAARAADRASVAGYSGSGANKSGASSSTSSRSGVASGSGGLASYSGGSAGKAATSGGANRSGGSSVSGASRSTAGKGGASPSAASGAVSGASRSTAGKTSNSGGYSSTGGGGVSGAGVGQGGIGSR